MITTTSPRHPRALRHWVLAVGVTLGSLGAVGCGDDDDSAASGTTGADGGGAETTAAGGGAGGAAVPYPVDSLQYNDVTAPAGGTIEIENSSGTSHTFTSDDGSSFDVQYGTDETADVTVPTEAGDYPFHCNIHANMKATLTVQ